MRNAAARTMIILVVVFVVSVFHYFSRKFAYFTHYEMDPSPGFALVELRYDVDADFSFDLQILNCNIKNVDALFLLVQVRILRFQM